MGCADDKCFNVIVYIRVWCYCLHLMSKFTQLSFESVLCGPIAFIVLKWDVAGHRHAFSDWHIITHPDLFESGIFFFSNSKAYSELTLIETLKHFCILLYIANCWSSQSQGLNLGGIDRISIVSHRRILRPWQTPRVVKLITDWYHFHRHRVHQRYSTHDRLAW